MFQERAVPCLRLLIANEIRLSGLSATMDEGGCMSRKRKRVPGKLPYPPAGSLPPDELLARLGMSDLDTARPQAAGGVSFIKDAAKEVIAHFPEWCHELVVFQGLVGRAQGFHDGTTRAIEDGNPYAAFTLLRSYAENAAAVGWLADSPRQYKRFLESGPGPSVGALMAHARKGSAGVAGIYAQLSEYAHPAERSVMASHDASQREDGTIRFAWHSAPRFRSRTDQLMACAWQWELAEAHGTLLINLGVALVPLAVESISAVEIAER